MSQFPYLSSLMKKNEHCSKFFRQSLKNVSSALLTEAEMGSKGKSKTAKFKGANGTPPHHHSKDFQRLSNSNPNSPEETGNNSNNLEQKLIHWKKKVCAKFEIEADTGFCNKLSRNDITNFVNFHQSHTSSATSTDCAVCDRTFPSRRQLNEHKSFAHFPPYGTSKEFCYVPYFTEPKKFDKAKKIASHAECSLCQKWFGGIRGNMEAYLESLKEKTKEKEECNRRGRKPKSVTARRRVCELCSKILSNRKGLERHMLIHTGEKPFPCDICGKPFRRKDNCVRHKKTAHLFKKPRKPRRRRSQITSTSLMLDTARVSNLPAPVLEINKIENK